ncbi:ferrous iron transport protein A [Chloroflexota bacterium]
MSIKSLSELVPGDKGRIVKVRGGKTIHRRLRDMGLVAESEVEVERKAPLGDPIEVKIKGYHLALRKEEAAGIQVEVS